MDRAVRRRSVSSLTGPSSLGNSDLTDRTSETGLQPHPQVSARIDEPYVLRSSFGGAGREGLRKEGGRPMLRL